MFCVGLDVSVARTAVCIMDAAGRVIHEKSVASTPDAIVAAIRASGMEVDRIGLAGINSAWIARGLPVPPHGSAAPATWAPVSA